VVEGQLDGSNVINASAVPGSSFKGRPGKVESAELTLAHLETVVEGRVYIGTRAEIDHAIEALTDTGLRPELVDPELVKSGQGTRRYLVGDRTIEFRERETVASKRGDRVVLAGGDQATMLEYLSKVPAPEPGVVEIVVHGSVDDLIVKTDHGNITLDHRRLATYIKKSGAKFKRIRLLACKTGQHPQGVAQHLANKLGVPVEAPSDKLWIHPDGSMTIGPEETRNTGRWEKFAPQPSKARLKRTPEPAPSTPRERLAAKRAESETEPKSATIEIKADRSTPASKAKELGASTAEEISAATRATIDQLALVPVAKVPKGATVVGDIEPLHHDTYYVSPPSAKRMLDLLVELEPTVQTHVFPKGYVVRRGTEEWYFEILERARKMPSYGGERTNGLPSPNVATVELWAFRGVREIAGRSREQWTATEREEIDRIKTVEPLLYTGHVGISTDGGKMIYGFTPDYPRDMSPDVLMKSLMAHEAYPGVVQDDTAIFREAERMAKEQRWNTQPLSAVELVDAPKKLSVVSQLRRMTESDSGENGLGYSFPLPQPKNGEHFGPSNGFQACDVRNCATFPEKVGIPVPEASGNLKQYMQELEKWVQAERPQDFRTPTPGDRK